MLINFMLCVTTDYISSKKQFNQGGVAVEKTTPKSYMTTFYNKL